MFRRLTLVLALLVVAAPTPAGAVTQTLPDLSMARLRGFLVKVEGSTVELRFTAIIVNKGAGAFEVRGSRPDTSTALMAVKQRIYADDGSFTDVATDAVMYWAGDGHKHWHVRNLERYVLTPLGSSGERIGVKSGFCFFDNYQYNVKLPGAPQLPVYDPTSVCSKRKPSALTANAGLSVGWGDKYGRALPDQYVDITGLPDGDYRLTATADAQGWFSESDTSNNSTYTDLRITGTSVKVIGRGPAA